MYRFIIVCFFFLGWVFYEASGGADFKPTPRAKIEKPAPLDMADLASEPTAPATLTESEVAMLKGTQLERPQLVSTQAPTPMDQRASTPEPKAAMPSAEATQKPVLAVKGTRVNMRNGPGKSYGVVARLTKGSKVDVLQDPGTGWLKLKAHENGRIGWMAASLLVPAQ